jgi:hypothetical protein
MKTFTLQNEFTDVTTERALIAAVSSNPELFWKLGDVSVTAFFDEAESWLDLSEAIRTGQQPPRFEGWEPTDDPESALRRLNDLLLRRTMAAVLEECGSKVFDLKEPATAVLTWLKESVARAHGAAEEARAGQVVWAADLISEVMRQAEDRARLVRETGKSITGLSTGIRKLDEILNGLNAAALYLLAGGPGSGKTTLVLQIAESGLSGSSRAVRDL